MTGLSASLQGFLPHPHLGEVYNTVVKLLTESLLGDSKKLLVMAGSCGKHKSLSTQEVEVAGPKVEGLSLLQSELALTASLVNLMSLCFKAK